VADHLRLVLVNTPHMSARTAVVAEVRVRIFSYVRQIVSRVLRAARRAIGDWCHGSQVLIQRRGVQFVWKCHDVVDQIRAFFVHGPDVTALGTAVVVSAGQVARGRQKPARRTATRWTVRVRGYCWGSTDYPSEMAVALLGNLPNTINASAVSGPRPSLFGLFETGASKANPNNRAAKRERSGESRAVTQQRCGGRNTAND
jgi:hypothetical protein